MNRIRLARLEKRRIVLLIRPLQMTDCDATMISGLGNVKQTVKRLVIHYTLEKLSVNNIVKPLK